MAEAGNDSRGAESPPPGEWVAGGIGFLLLSASIAFLLWQAVDGGGPVPVLSVEAGDVTRQGGGYLLEFTVTNGGGMTASDVLVEGALKRGGTSVESSEVTVDYVPPRSKRTGGLIFSRDPRSLEVELRAHGYREP